ncbi:hypothetical protein GIB67_029581 [Kingdonia uniflora]|uniref:Dof zinc finger protein n=1 Tax=Kingdonia uniflora TaxID=39325 RepID=A0A7J7LLI3_9MAGN|nr:hypothetical protein GIB67_029581 [Kingdonia uniflora]
MFQELLGGAGLVLGGDNRNTSMNGVLEEQHSSTPSHTLSSSATTATTTTSTTSVVENLRCPRCDSPNTKFCYYNNYNLTQPRHFCKTCRRYWTKGGSLRNIPIGGGCRKNKGVIVSSSAGKLSTGKLTSGSSDIVKSSLAGAFDYEGVASNPILWGSPQNSHLLALLRSTQNQNPNPSTNSNLIAKSYILKDDGAMIGSHVSSALNAPTLTLDPLTQVNTLGFWRNNQHHQNQQQQHHQQQQQSLSLGEAQNTGIQELYQRYQSPGNTYFTERSRPAFNGVTITSSSAVEPTPVTGGDMGFWNPISWSDLPTTSGAFP